MNKLTLIVFSLPLLFSCSDSVPKLPDMPNLSEIKEKLPDMPDILPDFSIPDSYKSDVLQGSVLDRYSVNQLKIGMTKSQVTDLIGSPSIIDLFHNAQWDYINFSTLHQRENIRYRLTLKFDGDLLVEIDTSGLNELPPLTAEEQALENNTIAQKDDAEEAKRLEELRLAEQAQIAKAKADAAEAKRLEELRLAEQAQIAKAKADAAEAKRLEELRLAEQAQIAKAKADAASIKKTENESLRYKIKRGDTLSVIARKHNTSVKQLKEINNLSTDFIRTGDVLIIHLSKLDTIKKKIAKEAAAQKAAEADRVAKEKAEAERVAKEKAEAERVAKEKAEAERVVAKEKAEAERVVAKEKAEADRIAKERAAKLAKEAEEKRIIEEVLEAAQKAEEERIALEASKPWYQFW